MDDGFKINQGRDFRQITLACYFISDYMFWMRVLTEAEGVVFFWYALSFSLKGTIVTRSISKRKG